MKHILLMFGVLAVVSTISFAQEDYKTYDEGIAKFKSGEYQSVIDLFSKVLADPKHSKKLDEDLYFYRGQSYYFTDNVPAAVSDLDQALLLDHYHRAVIFWFKARCADKQGKDSEAVDLYNQALTAAEKNKKVTVQILADRAAYHARKGNATASKEDLDKAKALDPNNPELAKVNAKPSSSKEEKKTQVIVKQNNPKQTSSNPQVAANTPTQTTKPTEKPVEKAEEKKVANNEIKLVPENNAQTSNNSVSMVSALAETYKDEKRFALVIGNSNYSKEIGMLKNPVNDATDVATELRKSNFDVQLLTNATYIQIREAMRKFQQKLTDAPKDQTVGLFYYAGHGVQYQDENYLVPIDANVKYEDDIVRMCFPVQRMVLNNMENTNSRMNIIILDACRNNPFPATNRSVGGGLAEMKRARGSFIAYATAPGSVASDGEGRNGLYTQELLKALRRNGLTIEQVFKEVRMNVLRLSGEKQYTWDSSNIIGEFYFKF
jgi:tetratricopeptide (TPR) repeat protein